jgi:hypothetical protein
MFIFVSGLKETTIKINYQTSFCLKRLRRAEVNILRIGDFCDHDFEYYYFMERAARFSGRSLPTFPMSVLPLLAA